MALELVGGVPPLHGGKWQVRFLRGLQLGDHVPRLASYTCNVAVKGSIPLFSTIIWLFKKLFLPLLYD